MALYRCLRSKLFTMESLINSFQRNISLTNENWSKLEFGELEEMANASKIDIASRSDNKHPMMLMGYIDNGFNFLNMSVTGPIVILDRLVFRWNVKCASEITEESFAMFQMIYPKIDLIVLGTGEKFTPLPIELTTKLREQGLGVEVQSTKNACGTFNLLLQQKPTSIAAALLPCMTQNHGAVRKKEQRFRKYIKM